MEFQLLPGLYVGCLKAVTHSSFHYGGVEVLLCRQHRPEGAVLATERAAAHITRRWLLPDDVFHHRLGQGCAECSAPLHKLDLDCNCHAARILRWALLNQPGIQEDSGYSSSGSGGL